MPFSAALYPVGLVLAGRPCLVVGGGDVARRKVEGLLRAGATTTVVAPEIAPELRALPVRIEPRPYRRGEVAAYRFAVAATGRAEVDRAVSADGEAAGVWVNAADDPGSCSAVLPAVLRRGPLTISVATGGESPAVASWLRDRIAVVVTEQHADLARLATSARRRIHDEGGSSEGLPWSSLLDELADLLAAGRGTEAAEKAARFAEAAARSGRPRSTE